jgi:hypothetical protein
VGFVVRENEDLVDGDGIKPSLDPAPYSREEGGCANNLVGMIVLVEQEEKTHGYGWPYKYSIQGFRIMCSC